MPILVDSSVWIDYFRDGRHSSGLDQLIDNNLIATNALILTELIPALTIHKEKKLITLLRLLPILPLTIDFEEITHWQTQCLKKAINGIGIPDFIIAQNAQQHHAALYTLDNHFTQLHPIISLALLKP